MYLVTSWVKIGSFLVLLILLKFTRYTVFFKGNFVPADVLMFSIYKINKEWNANGNETFIRLLWSYKKNLKSDLILKVNLSNLHNILIRFRKILLRYQSCGRPLPASLPGYFRAGSLESAKLDRRRLNKWLFLLAKYITKIKWYLLF